MKTTAVEHLVQHRGHPSPRNHPRECPPRLVVPPRPPPTRARAPPRLRPPAIPLPANNPPPLPLDAVPPAPTVESSARRCTAAIGSCSAGASPAPPPPVPAPLLPDVPPPSPEVAAALPFTSGLSASSAGAGGPPSRPPPQPIAKSAPTASAARRPRRTTRPIRRGDLVAGFDPAVNIVHVAYSRWIGVISRRDAGPAAERRRPRNDYRRSEGQGGGVGRRRPGSRSNRCSFLNVNRRRALRWSDCSSRSARCDCTSSTIVALTGLGLLLCGAGACSSRNRVGVRAAAARWTVAAAQQRERVGSRAA